MTSFTPYSALLGGALIGAAAAVLMALQGRIAGISGIVAGLLRPRPGEWGWRAAFVAGLIVGPLVYSVALPLTVADLAAPSWLTVVAGLLVGFGTRLGGGCTSGHGVCGIARWSPRSVVATVTFMLSAVATVYVVRHLLESGLA